jgi:hypothetical protein
MPDLSYSSLSSPRYDNSITFVRPFIPSHLSPCSFPIPFPSVLSSSLFPSFPIPSRYNSSFVPVLPPLSLFSFRPYFVCPSYWHFLFWLYFILFSPTFLRDLWTCVVRDRFYLHVSVVWNASWVDYSGGAVSSLVRFMWFVSLMWDICFPRSLQYRCIQVTPHLVFIANGFFCLLVMIILFFLPRIGLLPEVFGSCLL